MKRLFIITLTLSSIFFYSCSLLEVSMTSDTEPLSKDELSKRFATRTFSSDFITQVSMLADSIATYSEATDHKKNAIQWKLNVANTLSPIAFQSKGDFALLETWIFCSQMNTFLSQASADSLFGSTYASQVQACANEGLQHIDRTAKRLFSKEDYTAASQFVNNYASLHPFSSLQFSSPSIIEQYQAYRQIPDSLLFAQSGTIANIVGDLTERLEMYGKQMQRNIDWRTDLITSNWDADSVAQQFMQQTDTLTALLYALSDIARHSPELAEQIAANMNAELQPIIGDISELMFRSMAQFSQQRDSVQLFINAQRMALQQDITKSGDSLMHSAADSLAQFVHKISFILVLVVLLLVLILFGLPFFLGFYIAKLRYRPHGKAEKKNE